MSSTTVDSNVTPLFFSSRPWQGDISPTEQKDEDSSRALTITKRENKMMAIKILNLNGSTASSNLAVGNEFSHHVGYLTWMTIIHVFKWSSTFSCSRNILFDFHKVKPLFEKKWIMPSYSVTSLSKGRNCWVKCCCLSSRNPMLKGRFLFCFGKRNSEAHVAY